MVYQFTYYYKGRLHYETYTSDYLASQRFRFLVALNISFKVITTYKRRSSYD